MFISITHHSTYFIKIKEANNLTVRITAVANQKGGVSKSTTSHAVSTGLKARGYRVLTIDMDPQCDISRSMKSNIRSGGVFDVLSGEPAAGFIQTTHQGDILSGSQQLIGADKKFAEISSEYILADALGPIKNNYDYIIIDCPPQLGILTVNALVAATDVIVPITPDMYAMEGLSQLTANIKKIKLRPNPVLRISGILLTRYSGRSILNRDLKEAIEAQADEMGTKVYSAFIREGIAIREAQTQHTSIFDYAPASNQAQDYNDFINEYLNEGV
jgi:chromosome partitioning protein